MAPRDYRPPFYPPERWAAELRAAALEALGRSYDPATAAVVEQALARGDVELAIRLLFGDVDDRVIFPRWSPVTEALGRILGERAAQASELEIGAPEAPGWLAATGPRMRVRYDMGNTVAWNHMRDYQFGLVRGLDQETREGLHTYLRAGLQAGRNPRDTARQIRDIIGLTPRQAQAVANYRTALEQREASALQRVLRDRRFDPSVRAHLQGVRPLTQEKIDTLVAQEAMWRSAAGDGLIQGEAYVKRWVARLDGRTRPEHVALHGTEVALHDVFTMPESGAQVWGPPFAPNCRCVAWVGPLAVANVRAEDRAAARRRAA